MGRSALQAFTPSSRCSGDGLLWTKLASERRCSLQRVRGVSNQRVSTASQLPRQSLRFAIHRHPATRSQDVGCRIVFLQERARGDSAWRLVTAGVQARRRTLSRFGRAVRSQVGPRPDENGPITQNGTEVTEHPQRPRPPVWVWRFALRFALAFGAFGALGLRLAACGRKTGLKLNGLL